MAFEAGIAETTRKASTDERMELVQVPRSAYPLRDRETDDVTALPRLSEPDSWRSDKSRGWGVRVGGAR